MSKPEHKVKNSTPDNSQKVLLTDAELEQWALEKVYDSQCDICGRDFFLHGVYVGSVEKSQG